MRKMLKEFFLINFGLLLVAIGIAYFFAPNNLAAGGISGLSILINHFVEIPVGFVMLGVNVILFVVGFIFIGKDFGAKTIYSSLALSGMVSVMEKFFPISEPISDDIFAQMVFAIMIVAAGMSIVFNQNASTGGTDIIAKILNKFFDIEIGKAVLAADFFIILGAFITFGIEKGIYALIGAILNSLIIDGIINGLNTHKQVIVISERSCDIKEFIVGELGRGATVYEAKGAFTQTQKEVISTIVGRKEFIRLRDYIKAMDGRAFISVSNVHEILGEGFKSLE